MQALFIHGFEGSSRSNWLPWLERELRSRGYEVMNETFPDPVHPDFDTIMSFLREKARDFGTEDMVVAHSLGAFFALKLFEEKELGGLYLVAPAFGADLPFDAYRRMWPGSDVDALEKVAGHGVNLNRVKARIKVAFFSDDDQYIPLETSEKLDASWKILILKGRGHFQQPDFPELLNVIEKFM